MKPLATLFAVLAIAAPVAGFAQTVPPAAQRQAILDLEYQLNQPGIPASGAAAAQQRVAAIEARINGTGMPALDIPVYGSCEADRAVISYLQDEAAHGDIDAQQRQIDERGVYDLTVNVRQRDCSHD